MFYLTGRDFQYPFDKRLGKNTRTGLDRGKTS
jgi:hypothetical protein